MKMTIELPDELIQRIKIFAAATDRNLKDTVDELLGRGLEVAESGQTGNPLQTLKGRLRFNPDGTVTNPYVIDDPGFFQALDEIRAQGRRAVSGDPLAREPSGENWFDPRP